MTFSVVALELGLFRDGFRLGGDDAELWEAGDLMGDVDFLMGTGIGRIGATGLTAVDESEP